MARKLAGEPRLRRAGAIIETHTRGDFHVIEDAADVRRELRLAWQVGGPAVFETRAGERVAISYDQVRRVRRPDERSRLRRRLEGWALFAAGLALLCAGVAGICVGGSALILHAFGNGDETPVHWGWAFVGAAGYYGGAWMAHNACEQLGID